MYFHQRAGGGGGGCGGKRKRKIMQPLKICIGSTIGIGRESWCFPYTGFLTKVSVFWGKNTLAMIREGF